MSSSNAVVNSLNWVGKWVVSAEVVALAMGAALAVAILAGVGFGADRPWGRPKPKKRAVAVGLVVSLILLACALNTLTSTKPMARTVRAVKGGLFLGAVV